ncbi:MAG: hypothetical protein DHS20C21_04810 [Gemmatimonadota bacterium]|nr:MAG: hypothetical protein DHS20C21_04810 [Gemmatimonadota bacterium]
MTDYLEGALGKAGKAAFEEHVADCPRCIQHLDEFRRTLGTVGELRDPPCSPDSLSEALEMFRRWKRIEGLDTDTDTDP